MSYTDPKPQAPKPQKRRGNYALWRLMDQKVPWYSVAAAFVAILLMAWVLAGRFDQGIASLRLTVERARDEVFEKEREILSLSEQVRLADTDQFIAREARSKYGYLFPGEIRFVVTNPEVLGLPPRQQGAPQDVQNLTPTTVVEVEGFTPQQNIEGFTPLDDLVQEEGVLPETQTDQVQVPEGFVVDVFIPPASSPGP